MQISKPSFLILLFYVSTFIQAQTEIISFEGVNVIPMSTDTVLKNQRVIVANGKILKIESSTVKPSITINIKISAADKYLLPGFIETHYHLQNNIEDEFKLLIANGITTARNMAEYNGQDHIKIRELATNNSILSPHYFTTGPYLKRNDFKTIDSVHKVVSYHKEMGYDYLKLADNLPKNIYLELLELTNKENIAIIGHGQRELPLEYSLRMKSIAHIEEFMNIFSKKQKNSINYLNKAAKDIKTSGVYVSPTLGIFEMISRYADNSRHIHLISDPNIKYLPKHYSDYWKSDKVRYRTSDRFTLPKSLERLDKELDWQKLFTKILHNHGVPLMAGSDTYGLFIPGFSLHHELELLHSSGLSTYETLKTVTVIPSRYLNRYSISGTISEGKLADLILLSKNPLENIKNTQSIWGVMIRGKWLDRQALDEILKDVENSNN